MRQRQGSVPDLHAFLQWQGRGPERALLLEFKTLHFGSSTYVAGSQRCAAIERHSGELPREYAGKARKLDQDYCGTLPGSLGPVEARLCSFEPVKGLVFGAFREGSPDVHQLLSALASSGSIKHWRAMRATEPEDIRGALACLLKRRWAMMALRGCARLTLGRLELVGQGAAAAKRRRGAATGTLAAARRASCWARRGPVVQRCAGRSAF
jgi:hypothetical protein